MSVDFTVVLPELIVAMTAIALVVADLILPRSQRQLLPWLSIAGLAAAAIDVLVQRDSQKTGFSGSVVLDGFSLFCDGVFLLAGILTVLLSMDYLEPKHINLGEYYVLVLSALSGMMLMAAANNLIVIFLALELFSICLYVLAGFDRTRGTSQEAALKYFLLSAFASAFLLYGMALIYGATGSISLPTIEAFLKTGAPGSDPVLLAGVGLMVVGFAFKMSAVPFHAWTPDVYEGSPTPIAAMMSVGTKLAAFSAFLRLFAAALPQIHEHWAVLIWLLAVLTMVIGNVAAIAQTNVKRLLAYSSIAHAGYLLIAVYASRAAVTASGVYTGNGSSGDGLPSLLFYFVVYALMNIGAFAVVTALARSGEENTTFVDFAGLGMRHPWLAGSMTLFLFSLASFPPTAGFWAKFYVFQTALQAGHGELAVIGVLCSLISVFYYLRVVYVMYFLTPSGEPRPFTAPISLSTVVGIAAAGTVLLGFWPTELLTVAQGAKMVF